MRVVLSMRMRRITGRKSDFELLCLAIYLCLNVCFSATCEGGNDGGYKS